MLEVKLNLGCGSHYLEGFIDVDDKSEENVKPDLVCDVCGLPFKKEIVSEIYAGHILEHINIESFVKEIKRILTEDGVLWIVIPDFGKISLIPVEDFKNGWVEWGESPEEKKRGVLKHTKGLTGERVKNIFKEAGFSAEVLKLEECPHLFDYVGWQSLIKIKKC